MSAIKHDSGAVLFITLLVVLFASCARTSNNDLDDKIQTVELTHIVWGCDCADWTTKEALAQYADEGDTLAHLSFFIEPATSSLELPDTLGYNNDIIRFTGQFYKDKGFPKGYVSIENPEKAKVFRYTSYEVVSSHYKYAKNLLK